MLTTITLTMATPILAPQRGQVWVLDRWLAGAAALEQFPDTMTQRHPGFSDWIPESLLNLPLQIDDTTQVYQVTQAQFPRGGQLSSHYRSKNAIEGVWLLDGKGKGQGGFMSSGIFKAAHNLIPVWEIPAITFSANITDSDRLMTLLDILWQNGIGGDRTRGYGMIADITLSPTDTDLSCLWTADGEPTRPIPWKALSPAQQLSCQNGLIHHRLQLLPQRVTPPAWTAKNQTLCIFPNPEWPTEWVTATKPTA